MNEIKTQESFRDHIATVTTEGKRKWIFPKKPSGRFYNARTIVSIFLLGFLIVVPFVFSICWYSASSSMICICFIVSYYVYRVSIKRFLFYSELVSISVFGDP